MLPQDFYCCEETSWPRQLLIKETFNWGGSLMVSEMQSIITMMGWWGTWCYAGKCGAGVVAESPTSYRQQEVN